MSNPDTTTFAVGDRVRLSADGADRWIDKRLALRAMRGTPGTVVAIIGTAIRARDRSYRIEFDAVGRMKPMSEIIPVDELETMQHVPA